MSITMEETEESLSKLLQQLITELDDKFTTDVRSIILNPDMTASYKVYKIREIYEAWQINKCAMEKVRGIFFCLEDNSPYSSVYSRESRGLRA